MGESSYAVMAGPDEVAAAVAAAAPGVVVVEGVGCTGKTTLIGRLAGALEDAGRGRPQEYRRWGRHKEWRWADRDPYRTGTHGSLFVMDYLTQVDWAAGHRPVLLDRAYPSALAYNGLGDLPEDAPPELAERRMELFCRLLGELAETAGARVALCRLPAGATLQYILERRYAEYPGYRADPRWSPAFLEAADARFAEIFGHWLPPGSALGDLVLEYRLRLPDSLTLPFLGLAPPEGTIGGDA